MDILRLEDGSTTIYFPRDEIEKALEAVEFLLNLYAVPAAGAPEFDDILAEMKEMAETGIVYH